MAYLTPRSLMIHVPKTGGTWCFFAMQTAGIKVEEPWVEGSANVIQSRHCRIVDIVSFIQHRLTFSFIRHPMAWLRSQWCYACDRNAPSGWKPDEKRWIAHVWSDDYPTFVQNVLDQKPTVPTNGMLGRAGYEWNGTTWVRGAHAVRFIGRTETLAADLCTALELAGEQFDREALSRVAPMRVSVTRPNGKVSKRIINGIEQANDALMNIWTAAERQLA